MLKHIEIKHVIQDLVQSSIKSHISQHWNTKDQINYYLEGIYTISV